MTDAKLKPNPGRRALAEMLLDYPERENDPDRKKTYVKNARELIRRYNLFPRLLLALETLYRLYPNRNIPDPTHAQRVRERVRELIEEARKKP